MKRKPQGGARNEEGFEQEIQARTKIADRRRRRGETVYNRECVRSEETPSGGGCT